MRRHSCRAVPVAVAMIATGLTLGCGDDGDTVETDDITGDWQATSVEYEALDGSQCVDVIALGGTATLRLGGDGSFEYVHTMPGSAPDTLRATWQLMGDIGDLMRVTPIGVPWYWAFDVALSGGTLKLTGGGAQYDFDGDGAQEGAKWNLAFTRIGAPD